MHAAKYTTTPISWRLKRASQATDPRKRKPRSSKMSREELGKARRGAHREREPHTIYTLSSRLRCKGYFVACRSMFYTVPARRAASPSQPGKACDP